MPTIDMTATGKNITRMMKAAGMTVKDLQEIFGFATPQAIYKWKNGTAMPTIDNLVILAVTLGCNVIFLLFRKYSLYIANKRYRGNYFFLLFLK